MTEAEAFQALAASLAGVPISRLWRGYGSAVFLELGRLTEREYRWNKKPRSTLYLQGEVSIGIEWSWRIQDARSVLCGSWSDEALWEPSFNLLRGARIRGCTLFGALPEIEVATDKDVSLLSFTTTDGQPEWHVVDRRDDPERWFTVREGRLHLGDGHEPA